jgi:hypothetical protein
MGGAGFLAVKNFERFQHYKNRNPPWIKFYASILFDYEFQSLPDKSKAHLMLIWLLISQRHDHRIPNDARWIAQRIGATEKVDLQILIDGGWLISLADRYQPSINGASKSLEQSREETEEKRVEEKAPDPELVSPQDLVEGWNDTCGPLGLPTVRELSADRLTKVRARLKEHPKVFFWNDVLAGIEKSTFLRGLSGRNGDHKGWKASFDWLIENPTNCLKIAEGQYNG